MEIVKCIPPEQCSGQFFKHSKIAFSQKIYNWLLWLEILLKSLMLDVVLFCTVASKLKSACNGMQREKSEDVVKNSSSNILKTFLAKW